MLLFNKSLTAGQKKFQWLNAINHLNGLHGNCLHSFQNIKNSPDPIESKDFQMVDENERVSSDDLFQDNEDLFQDNEDCPPPSEANDPPPVLDQEKFRIYIII